MIFTWSSTAIATIPDSPSSAKRLKSGISIFSNQYSQETAIQTSIDAEHEAIFAAYQNGEQKKAVQMMKTHLNDSHALLLVKYSGPAAAYCASSGTHFIFFISPSKSIRIRSQTFCYQRQIMGKKKHGHMLFLLNLFRRSTISFCTETSSALVASSQIQRAGCRSSALAIQTPLAFLR